MYSKRMMGMLALLGSAAFLVGCETTPTQQGALTGAAIGAGAGAIIGNQSHGRSGEGALIGAGVGAITGALIGDRVDENRTRRNQQMQQAPPPAPAPAPAPQGSGTGGGHWESRTHRTESGETYEERVWVPN